MRATLVNPQPITWSEVATQSGSSNQGFYWPLILVVPALFLLLKACSGFDSAKLSDCVIGASTSDSKLLAKLAAIPNAKQLDLAIDGSGSMLGLTGSAKASAAWKAMLRSVTLASAASGTPVNARRSGSGGLERIQSVREAANPCFFSGCGGFQPVTSSIDSLWKRDPVEKGSVPLRMAITDLEVNDGEISGLVSAIKPHVANGAVIGLLAVKLPFNGRVFNSESQVIHAGESDRPIYLLTTGPKAQVHELLNEIRSKAAMGGVPSGTMQITYMDDRIREPTLKAAAVEGVPIQAITSGLPVRIGNTNYSQASNPDVQFVRLSAQAQGVRLASRPGLSTGKSQFSDLGLVALEPVGSGSTVAGVSVKDVQIQGKDLIVELSVSPGAPASVIRASVPRGQLPEDWWLRWNRGDPSAPEAKEQTDGLLLLLTSLGRLQAPLGSTPASAFCLAFSHT